MTRIRNEHRAPCACPIHTPPSYTTDDLRPYQPTAYDVQEDKTTRRCAGCRATLWADEPDLCQRCDVLADYQWLAAIHADRTPRYYPDRPLPCRAGPTGTGADTTEGTP